VHGGEQLRGELARRRQDERARHPARPADQFVENRKEKRRGLPRSGYRGREQVAAFERRWYRVGLNRRRAAVPEILESALEGRMEFQIGERHFVQLYSCTACISSAAPTARCTPGMPATRTPARKRTMLDGAP